MAPLLTAIETGTGAKPEAVEKFTEVGFTTNCGETVTVRVTGTAMGAAVPPAGVKVTAP